VLQEHSELLTILRSQDHGYSDNSDIEIEADSIIDFSNTNPFGMP
jgi:hypothetical protein